MFIEINEIVISLQRTAVHSQMYKRLPLVVLVVVFLSVTTAATVFSKPTQSRIIDAQLQKEIIDTVGGYFDRIYVFPEVASRMGEYLNERFSSGAYKAISSAADFADTLTADMRSISKDKHISIYYLPAEYFQPDSLEEIQGGEWEKSLAGQKYFNFDFVKVERLLGNIGYMKFNQFRDAEEASATAMAALNFLAHCDALIIDLRSNGGGESSMIQLISSYFFDEPRHLNSFYNRQTDSIEEFWTNDDITGPSMVDIDLFILISGYTFSAAEEFAYNLKHMGRATLIGDTTAGGAHPVEYHDIEHLNIKIKVPFGRAINPITGTNWERVGVKPDIEASYSESSDIAYLEAAKRVRAKTTNDYKAARLDWAIRTLEVKLNPVVVDEQILSGYAGAYGDYEISLVGGVLYIREGEYPSVELKPLSNSLFQWGNNQYLRIEFQTDQDSNPSGLVAHEIDDGTIFLGEKTR